MVGQEQANGLLSTKQPLNMNGSCQLQDMFKAVTLALAVHVKDACHCACMRSLTEPLRVKLAVLTPTKRAKESSKGPPLLPALMLASVCSTQDSRSGTGWATYQPDLHTLAPGWCVCCSFRVKAFVVVQGKFNVVTEARS